MTMTARRATVMGMTVGLVLLVSRSFGGAITSGQLLTNFASATFSAPSGVGMESEFTGYGVGRVPNSQSSWVGATDSPQTCIRSWKTASSGAASPGDTVTFRIAVQNCGGNSALDVTVTDMLPPNTRYMNNARGWTGSAVGTWWNDNPASGTAGPVKLQWMLNVLGVGSSAYVEFEAQVQ